MKIQSGIAYAKDYKPLVRVTSVAPRDNYKLLVGLSNGVKREFAMKHLLDKPVYSALKNKEVFKTAYVDYGTVVWNDGQIDISPEFFQTEQEGVQ